MKFLPALTSRRTHTKDIARRVDAVFRTTEQKQVFASYVNTLMMTAGGTRDFTRPWPIERAVAEGYERVLWVFKSVNTIATDQARLPYKVREGDDGDPLDDHPMYRLLNMNAEGRANPLETGHVLRKRLSSQILLSKAGAFVERTLSNGGTPIRYDLLPPGRTIPIPGTGADLIDHWQVTSIQGKTRPIELDKVLWFRDPHPLDAYSGTTPLESAGMSTELDYFARLYNVSFMRNDGRPGGIVGIDPPSGPGDGGDMDPVDMDRIEAKFGKGSAEAGKIAVLSGKVTYSDLAARPRDMQYSETASNSKTELLTAFGVPESVLGFAADRTYANAEQELYNYWTRTMLGHNEIIVAGFAGELTGGLQGYLDTSSVEVLEKAQRDKRAEALAEFNAGVRSIYSYATLAGYADEIESTPNTRALFIPTGRTPLPANDADAEALGLSPAAGTSGAVASGDPAAAPNGGTAPTPSADGSQTGAQFEQDTPPTPAPTGQGPQQSVSPPTPPRSAAGDSVDRTISRPNLSVVGGTQRKARIRVERKTRDDDRESEPNLAATDRLEATLAAALSGLAPRWVERTAARLDAPKARMGTRHWVADSPTDLRVGTKAIDTSKAVDGQQWADDAEQQTRPLIEAAAITAAVAIATDLGTDNSDATARSAVASVVDGIVTMIRDSAAAVADALTSHLDAADGDGGSITDLATVARTYLTHITSWANNIATTAATATVAGAREAAADEAEVNSGTAITRTWVSRRDTTVRSTHAAADAEKQTRKLDEPFSIGNALLRYPADPLGPPGETRNCRCFLRHRATRTGRFAANPAKVAT